MTNQLPPLLSIVIPTHQRPNGLGQLLQSMTDQEFSFDQMEVLVVANLTDDPSRDTVAQHLALPVRWLSVGTKGVNLARNLGLRQARADVVLFLDDDCYLSHRYFLHDVLKAHVKQPTATAIGGSYFPSHDCSTVEEAYNLIALRWQERGTDRGQQINLLGGNVSYKKSLLKLHNLEFNDQIAFGGAETDLHLRIHQKGGSLVLLPHLSLEHRVRLTRGALMKKAFRQGMASHVRWMKGLFEITRPGPSDVVAPVHVQAVVKQFQRSFNWGSQFARDFEGQKITPLRLSYFFLRLAVISFILGLVNKSRQFLMFLRIGGPQKPILLDQPLHRFYVLPISKDCAHECAYAQRLGCRKVAAAPLAEELQRAKTYGFNEVLLPCNAHQQLDLNATLSKIRAHGLSPVLLLNGDDKAAISDQEIFALEAKASFHLLLGAPSTYQDHVLNLLRRSQPQLSTTFFFEDQRSGLNKLSHIPLGLENRTHVLFPSVGPVWHYHPNCTEIYDFLNKSSRKALSSNPLVVRSGSGYWPVERAEQNERTVWPLLNCEQSSGRASAEIQFSVIIPTFDSASYLKKVLHALTLQELSPRQFEVIVLDDGSRDHTREMLSQFISEAQPQFYLRYFHWERVEGKPEFRAGLIRNWGVSQSYGQYLCFIDSDILLQPSYLTSLARDFQDYDVIQAPREMLTEKASDNAETIRHFQGAEVYSDEKYWETFKGFECWSKIRKFWKYTCTYALAVRKDHFLRAGWFSPEFFSYGFEDVDLGYRLAKLGARFHLGHNAVYHLYPKRQDLNYHFDKNQRTLVLTHSSRVFYRNRLDPEIYKEFFPSYYQPLSGELKYQVGLIQEKVRREISLNIVPKMFFVPNAIRWKTYHFMQEGIGRLRYVSAVWIGRLRYFSAILGWRIPLAFEIGYLKLKAGLIQGWWKIWPFVTILLKPYYVARYQYHKRLKPNIDTPVGHVES